MSSTGLVFEHFVPYTYVREAIFSKKYDFVILKHNQHFAMFFVIFRCFTIFHSQFFLQSRMLFILNYSFKLNLKIKIFTNHWRNFITMYLSLCTCLQIVALKIGDATGLGLVIQIIVSIYTNIFTSSRPWQISSVKISHN